jgi:hypothetical protein
MKRHSKPDRVNNEGDPIAEGYAVPVSEAVRIEAERIARERIVFRRAWDLRNWRPRVMR